MAWIIKFDHAYKELRKYNNAGHYYFSIHDAEFRDLVLRLSGLETQLYG